MANLQERRNKDGKLISYSIRVFNGRDADGEQLKPFTATFFVEPTWSEKTARRKAEAFAATFEKECRYGAASDTRQRFKEYCEYVIDLKESRGVKHSTIIRYQDLTRRIYPAIGHIKLKDLRVDHLNTFYSALSKEENQSFSGHATPKVDLRSIMKDKGLSIEKIAKTSHISHSSIGVAMQGKTVSKKTAMAICDVLEIKYKSSFIEDVATRTLSAKTVLEHHRLISTVLEQAVKEGLIPFNPAHRAEIPKIERKTPNYFQPEQIAAIRDALETEPLKWKTLTHLFIITGARRGEILGLKWKAVDFEHNRIHICNNVLYSPDRGVYEDTPKTAQSDRFITLPVETMILLSTWKNRQAYERRLLGKYYVNQDFVFAQDNGSPMNPDAVTSWLSDFSKRHNLPHINPHAFRHTMASMLYFNGADSVSISKRLGHSKVSTTSDLYAHVIEAADQKNADILANTILRKA